MNRHEFLTRFQITQPYISQLRFRISTEAKLASVLIPLIETPIGLEVLMTVRARHLKHHGGQISFPGGRVEKQDTDVVAAALRESEEEIGLMANAVEIIGQLSPFHTISGFHVTPVIGLINKLPTLVADKNEVDEIFTVPLAFFLDANSHVALEVKAKGKSHLVHFMPYKGYNIWGATAAMLHDLSRQLQAH